jgi:hypothetical protein
MPSEMPPPIDAARIAWGDLHATATAHRGLAVVAIIACCATSLASLWLSLLFPALATDAPGASVRNALADLSGNVWRIFWAGTVAVLPVVLLSIIVGFAQIALDGPDDAWVRMLFAPLEGANFAAFYVLLVLIASRFYLALGNQLRQTA